MDDGSYSYDEDKKRYRKERRRRLRAKTRREQLATAPNRYSKTDVQFARRLRRGVTMMTGGMNEIE